MKKYICFFRSQLTGKTCSKVLYFPSDYSTDDILCWADIYALKHFDGRWECTNFSEYCMKKQLFTLDEKILETCMKRASEELCIDVSANSLVRMLLTAYAHELYSIKVCIEPLRREND